MNRLAQYAIGVHRRLLRLYPAEFRSEFGSEMQAVFAQAVLERQDHGRWVAFFLRECFDLPGALLRQYSEQRLAWFERGWMNTQNEYTSPSSRRAALLGALPFLAYGMVSLLTKPEVRGLFPTFAIQSGYFFLGFYLLALIGLLIGWMKGFPHWAYAYLGWALISAWLWNFAAPGGLKILGFTFPYRYLFGWLAWLPLYVVALLALAWTRSLRPVKQFFLGIWNDWTRLSFILFVFPAWMLLIYDENHHPYLLFFMLASTLIIGLAAYFYLRAASHLQRLLSLLSGTLVGLTLSWVCDSTWDFAAYYNLPVSHDPWYMAVFRWSMALVFITLFLLGPGLLALLRKGIGRRKA